MDTQQFQPVVVPYDEEGYVQSFQSSDNKLIDFFWKYGFVVIRDAISQEQIQASVDHIWSLMEQKGASRKPEDWLNIKWVNVFESNYNTKRGFLGFDPAVAAAGLHNIQSPPIHEAFSKIFNQKNLWAKLDRYGVMRPTKGLIDGDSKVDRIDWKTESHWVHWDQNPWTEPEFCRVQGLITLTDHTQNSGGFHCIPGFAPYMKTWAERNKRLNRASCLIDFPATDPIKQHVTKITMRPGSLLMWDSRTPHGNWPNDSENWRMVQYSGMFPVPQDQRVQPVRQNEAEGILRFAPGARMTVLGRKVLGSQPWAADEVSVGGVAKGGIFDENQCGY